MADWSHRTNQRPSTTLRRVEPEEHGLDRHWASSMWKALQDTLRSRDAYPRKFKGARGWRGVERLGDDEGLAEEVPLSQGGFRSLVS